MTENNVSSTGKSKLMQYTKTDWFASLKADYGMKCAGFFAKALIAEEKAGHTTEEAEDFLAQAVALAS
jgi:hypothetical protein